MKLTRSNTALTHHDAFERMARHRHGKDYVALVLAGGYVEAGDRGRFRVEAGHAIVHRAHEAHQDEFPAAGAWVLNFLEVEAGLDAPVGQVDDVDAIARLAERDPGEAFELLRRTFRPAGVRLNDWPDLLAETLASESNVHLAEWAETTGIAPESLSRGFRRAYGTSPKRYRLEQRTAHALRLLPGWQGSIATLAAAAGFADQAHLTRAVFALTGRVPSSLRG